MLTNIKRTASLFIWAISFTGCINSQNGTYQIYNVTTFNPAVTDMPAGYQDSVASVMQSEYSGNELKITYEDKYAKLDRVRYGTSLILNKVNNAKLGDHYFEKHTTGAITTINTLRHDKNNNLILVVEKSVAQPKPANYPTSPFDFSYQSVKSGIIVCYLTKSN